MSRLLLLGLLALAAAAPGGGRRRGALLIPDDQPPPQGVQHLQRRRYRLAASVFKQALRQRPEAEGTKVLLGQAYLGMHRCEEGLELLLPRVSLSTFGPEAAELMAGCYARDGELGEALYWMQLAELMAPGDLQLQATLAFYELAGGEPGAWDRLEAALEAAGEDDGALLTTRALMLLYVGEIDEAERTLERIRRIPGRRPYPMSFFIDARIELDLGNPVAAERLFGYAFWRNNAYTPTMLLWAEAARRSGVPEEALYILDTVSTLRDQPRRELTRTYRARAAVDLGQLELAQVLVAEALERDPLSPEAVASAWYLARAEGEAEAMAAWAERYALVQPSPLRTLERLIPIC